MIQIDGSQGEGGGQILRTALALSLVTGKSFVIKNIRAKRPKPGLLRQHLTAVSAAKQIGHAKVRGEELGSTELELIPGKVEAGSYEFSVGTAGSTGLVFQTILPPLLMTQQSSKLTLRGGTHNPFAPPFPFIEKVFRPVIHRMGPKIDTQIGSYGFYPAGGGEIWIDVHPAPLKKVEFLDRGEVRSVKAEAFFAHIPPHVALRELEAVGRMLDIPEENRFVREIQNSPGPGNMLAVTVESDFGAELFTSFGEQGVRAEAVADKVGKQALRYLKSDAPIGEHLADQLLIPMALAGAGSFRATSMSQHTKTNIDVISMFLDCKIYIAEDSENSWSVAIS